MYRKADERMELVMDVWLQPGLANAMKAWYEARYRFQTGPGWESLHSYNQATDALERAFAQDHAEEGWAPEGFEQFRRGLIEAE